MTINRIELLEKIILIQSCVIEGHSVKAILRKETTDFKQKSGADVIALCIENENFVNIELVLEEKRRFLSLLRKYKLIAKNMVLSEYIKQCNSRFNSSKSFLKLNSLYEIFQGTISKSKVLSFEAEMGFSEARIFALRDKNAKKIGFVVYFFCHDSVILDENLPEITKVFEILIRPFYDSKLQILHSKCVQVDDKMGLLTDREKQITQRVLQGKTHKMIAYELEISINTFKTHMKNIFNKYGVCSKMELNNKLNGSF